MQWREIALHVRFELIQAMPVAAKRLRIFSLMNAPDLAAHAATHAAPPAGLVPALRTLWLVKAGRWDDAHDLCQDLPDPAGAWIHAYLHRHEGDLANARYWYERAGKPTPTRKLSLDDEWLALAEALRR